MDAARLGHADGLELAEAAAEQNLPVRLHRHAANDEARVGIEAGVKVFPNKKSLVVCLVKSIHFFLCNSCQSFSYFSVSG